MSGIRIAGTAVLVAAVLTAAAARAGEHAHHEHHAPPSSGAQAPEPVAIERMGIPDAVLVDQDGRELHFYADLVKDRTVVINTIYTSCTTVCPPMGVHFSKLQQLLGERLGRDVGLISVSVDPAVDTPQRLKAWGGKFGAGAGWTLVTGRKREVDELLKALKVFTPDPEDHSPIVLIGNDARGEWTRTYGLAPPEKLAELVRDLAGEREARAPNGAAEYFTDVALVNQHGEEQRLYSDLLRGRSVVVNAFFTDCEGVCPALMAKLQRIQTWLGDRLGRDVHILSLTVDPETDTPARVREYAERFGPRPGWHFLTGDPEHVRLALYKLGQYVADPEAHTNVVIVGNEATGLWKKAFGLAATDELIRVIDSVVSDRG